MGVFRENIHRVVLKCSWTCSQRQQIRSEIKRKSKLPYFLLCRVLKPKWDYLRESYSNYQLNSLRVMLDLVFGWIDFHSLPSRFCKRIIKALRREVGAMCSGHTDTSGPLAM